MKPNILIRNTQIPPFASNNSLRAKARKAITIYGLISLLNFSFAIGGAKL